ncbi:tape measure protein [Sphingomonas sp. SFZ2018-12]|uniref:tape measure protein n=1 Tax=Sphingomonas sp. SFZ2018-12 TaxID=2683197 RepID=UPI001F1009DE|nr:tape measure protein [Sphingomonas sp. SFZ2018-12]MCH4894010.1 tape measure protein [Sphingomonas sp. SFZ2018-12]
MVDTVDTRQLLLQVDASIELLRRKLDEGGGRVDKFDREARRVLDRFDGRLRRTGADGMPQLERSIGNVSRSLSQLRGGFLGLITSQAVSSLVSYAEASKRLDAQLRLATATSGSFGQAQLDVSRVAEATRSPLEATANLYAIFQRSAAELGITQEQAARATETVTKTFAISGATASEAAGGLRQFVQGVQSGTLRGEELNSVLENAPRLARLLADSLGVTIGQLRELGQEGQLSGDKLIRALTDRQFTAGIDTEFQQLPVTIDQALTKVRNDATRVIGEFDRGGEFSSYIATFISDGSAGFASLGDDARELGTTIRSTLETLGDAFDPLVLAGRAFFGGLQNDTDSFSARFRREIGALFDRIDQLNAFGADYLGTARTRYAETFRSQNAAAGAANSDRRLREVLSSGQSRLFESLGLRNDGTPRASAVSAASSGAKVGRSAGRTGKSAEQRRLEAEKKAAEELEDTLKRLRTEALSDAPIDATRATESRLASFFDTGGFDELRDEAERRAKAFSDAELREIEIARQARDDALYASADLFETLFTSGTKGLWQQFKAEGLRAVALVLGSLAQGNSLSNALGSLSGSGSIFSGIGKLLGGTPKAATGGRIVGPGTGRSDSILARVSNGEFIVNAAAASENRALLEQINSGRMPSFAGGGYVAPRVSPGMMRPAAPVPAVVQVLVEEGSLFVPRVQQISGDVSVRVVDDNNRAFTRARRRVVPQ